MGSQPRQQHGVPACLLRRFTDECGMLWWASKEWTDGKVLKGKPETIFRKRDLNARITSAGQLDQEIEIKLGSWDTVINRIAEKLVCQGRDGKPPCLSASEKQDLDHYLFIQYKRTHENITAEDEDQIYKDLTTEEVREDFSHSEIDSKGPTGQSGRDVGARIVQNDKANSVLTVNKEVSLVLQRKGLRLCRAPKGQAFVMGAKGVITAGSGEGALHENNRGLVLPMASDILLYVGGHESIWRICDLSTEEVQYINRQTAGDCKAIAAREPDIVRSALFIA